MFDSICNIRCRQETDRLHASFTVFYNHETIHPYSFYVTEDKYITCHFINESVIIARPVNVGRYAIFGECSIINQTFIVFRVVNLLELSLFFSLIPITVVKGGIRD